MGSLSEVWYSERMNIQIKIIKDLGYMINNHSVILDLGCGNGSLVHAYRKNGYNAYGCDFELSLDLAESFVETGVIKKIESDNYQLPFDDNTFDFLYSDQVFEHVNDYSVTLSEINRVLKPEGISLHFFPSRYKIIEVHVKVPLGSLVKKRSWLKIWAFLGIKNEFQKGLSAEEISILNYHYLNNKTNYLKKSQLEKYCRKYFMDVKFCENLFIKYGRRARLLYYLSKVMPFVSVLYSSFHGRVLFFANKRQY